MPLPIVPIVTGLLKVKPILQKYWKEIGIASLIGLMWYQNFSENRYLFFMETIPSLEKRLSLSESNFRTCKDGNDTLKNSIEKRNSEIGQWKKLSGDLQERNDMLTDEISKRQQMTNEEVKEILNSPTPQSCGEAIDLLRGSTEELKW